MNIGEQGPLNQLRGLISTHRHWRESHKTTRVCTKFFAYMLWLLIGDLIGPLTVREDVSLTLLHAFEAFFLLLGIQI